MSKKKKEKEYVLFIILSLYESKELNSFIFHYEINVLFLYNVF